MPSGSSTTPTKSGGISNATNRLYIFALGLAVAVCCAGCGGGGGGGGGSSAASRALALSVTAPDLTGKSGSQVSIPVKVTGSGTVTNASFQLHFDAGQFQPLSGQSVAGPSIAATGLPSTSVCRYKWIDAQTIGVLYASSTGTASGNVIASIVVKATANKATNVAIQNSALNK